MRILFTLAVCLAALCVQAQAPGAQPWRVLNDSVYMVLGLSEDQVSRVKAIEEQYTEERMKLNSSPQTLDRTEVERRMSGLTADREKEVRGVMSKEQFEAWVGKRGQPAKATTKPARTK